MSDEHLESRGQEARIHGIAPDKSIDLEMYKGQHIQTNWDITGVTGDIIMCEYADEVEGAGLVDRGGIFVDVGVSKEMWRVVKIVKAGPGASDKCHEDETYVMFPNDRGIPITKFDGKNYIFLNESRIFCFVAPKPKDEKLIS